MTANTELSIVYPAFDEEPNVAPLLAHTLEWAPKRASSFEVIVVDDGSRDGTAARVREVAREDPRVRVVSHGENRGYGAALRTGFREAQGRLVFLSDADLQFDLAELERLLERIGDHDIVAGYRAPRRDPWPRVAFGVAWGLVVRAFFGLRIRDIDCAFKLYRREVLDAIEIESEGAFVSTEILLRARQHGFRITQVPVTHRPRRHGQQSGASPRVVLRAFQELFHFWRLRRRDPSLGAAAPRRASG